jgi:hypothetical protein
MSSGVGDSGESALIKMLDIAPMIGKVENFITQSIKKKKISTLLENRKGVENLKGGEKVLIVTDTISSGNSLVPLSVALKRNGIGFDIASVAIGNPLLGETVEKRVEILSKKLGGEITYGEYLPLGPAVYNQKALSGVVKQPRDLFATPYKTTDVFEGIYFPKEKDLQQRINAAREDVFHLADDLTDWYKSNEEKKMLVTEEGSHLDN